jgi:hypothetical protein
MKRLLVTMVLLGIAFSATAQMVTNQPARFKNKVTSYEGKIGSAASTGAIDYAVNNYPGTTVTTDKVTSPGKESELKWTFVGRNGSKDVYRFTFTRLTKPSASFQTTDSKEVQFEGKPIVVFEDALHAVVMESPSAEDLKSGQKTPAK